jgi:hypothetical protein
MRWLHFIDNDETKWPRRGLFIERSYDMKVGIVTLVLGFTGWRLREERFDFNNYSAMARRCYWLYFSYDRTRKQFHWRRGSTPMEPVEVLV